MSHWKLIRLNFRKNPAHFGEVGIGIEETNERVQSDGLFSAWITAYARLFGKEDVENLLKEIKKNPALFCHSSTFIYKVENYKLNGKKQKKYTYFLPKPIGFPPNYPVGEDLDFSKVYKKIVFLPLKIWQQWYQEKGFTDEDKQELIDETKKNKHKQYRELENLGLFSYKDNYKIDKLPKVAIDRNTSSSNFYHTGFVQFNYENDDQHSGLYFLVKFADNTEELQIKMCAALHLLGDEGLGGEKSSGAGRFHPEWLDLPEEWEKIINFNNPNSYSLISMFWKSQPPEFTPESYYSYQIQDRGGWIASPFSGRQSRRKTVQMFSEGSVFQFIPQGELADVTPDNFHKHRIYRSGISLSLPIQCNFNKDE